MVFSHLIYHQNILCFFFKYSYSINISHTLLLESTFDPNLSFFLRCLEIQHEKKLFCTMTPPHIT